MMQSLFYNVVKNWSKIFISLIIIFICLKFADKYFELRHKNYFISQFRNKWFIKLRSMSPNLNGYFRPTIEEHKKDSFPLEIKDYLCITDSNGLIVTEKNHSNPDIRIAFFGGSTAQCLYVDNEYRMPEAVARNIEKLGGLKVNVWNAAAGGSHSRHTLNVLNNLTFNLNLDYAFFYGNLNDIGVLIHYTSFNNKNTEKGVFFNYDIYEKEQFSIDKNKWLPYLDMQLKKLVNKSTVYDEYRDVRKNKLILDSTYIFPIIRRELRTIIYTCRANDIQPVFISQINKFKEIDHNWLKNNMPQFQPSPDEYEKFIVLLDQYNYLLKEVALNESISFIDLENTPTDFNDFNDAVHLNTSGSIKLSKKIAEEFFQNIYQNKDSSISSLN